MNVPLQQFGYRDSRYERPTSRWVCGWAAEGRPCPMGPDGKGRCSAELQGKCEPVKRGDRWHCTRPEAFGGPCDPGPRPDGSCGRPQPTHPVCQPRLSLRARRGRLTWACVALTVGALSMLIAGSPREWFINPGPLASQHAMLEAQFGKSGSCSQCHGPDGFSQALTGGLFQPVSDTACLKCHAAPAHHPSPQQIAAGSAMAQRCADCHTEHRGPEHHLSRVADRTCTTCHGNLPAVRPQTTVARRVTSFAADHPEARLIAARAIDETPLRFEHQVHMGTDDHCARWASQFPRFPCAGSTMGGWR
jgi:hypothetical protein